MPFRDEAEALRCRLEVLEAELARTEDALERTRESAEEAAGLRLALARTERELAELRGDEPPRGQRAVSAAMAGGLVFLIVGAMAARSTVSHPHVIVMQPPPARGHALPMGVPAGNAPLFMPVIQDAEVHLADGSAPVPAGTRCEVLIAPTQVAELPCRVTITCAGELVYGGENQGYLGCAMRGGVPVDGIDDAGIVDDGDPMLHLDLAARQIRVTNDRPSIWGLTLRLEDHQAQPGQSPHPH